MRSLELSLSPSLPELTGLHSQPLVARDPAEKYRRCEHQFWFCNVCATQHALPSAAPELLYSFAGSINWDACESCVALDAERQLLEEVLALVDGVDTTSGHISRHIGRVEFLGIYRDDVHRRTLPRHHGRRRLRAAVHTLMREMVQRGVREVLVGLQDGNEVWSEDLAATERALPFDRLGRTGDAPRKRSSGRTNLALGVPPLVGIFHTAAGGHHNAVYRLQLFTLDSPRIERALLACGADYAEESSAEEAIERAVHAVECRRALEHARLDARAAAQLVRSGSVAAAPPSLARLTELVLATHCARRVDECGARAMSSALPQRIVAWQLRSLRQESDETCGFHALWSALALLGAADALHWAAAEEETREEAEKEHEEEHEALWETRSALRRDALGHLARMVSPLFFKAWFESVRASAVEWVEARRGQLAGATAPPLRRSESLRKGELTRDGAALLLMNDAELSGLVQSGRLTVIADIDSLPPLPPQWGAADRAAAAARALSSALGGAFDGAACLAALAQCSGNADAAAALLFDGGAVPVARSETSGAKRRRTSVTSIFELDREVARIRREAEDGTLVGHAFVLGAWNHWITLVVARGTVAVHRGSALRNALHAGATDGTPHGTGSVTAMPRLELLLVESENKPSLRSLHARHDARKKAPRLAAVHRLVAMLAGALGVRLGSDSPAAQAGVKEAGVGSSAGPGSGSSGAPPFVRCAVCIGTRLLNAFLRLPFPVVGASPAEALAALDSLALAAADHDAAEIITVLLALSLREEPEQAVGSSPDELVAVLIAAAGLSSSARAAARVAEHVDGRGGLLSVLHAEGLPASAAGFAQWRGVGRGAVDDALLDALADCARRAVNTIAAAMGDREATGAKAKATIGSVVDADAEMKATNEDLVVDPSAAGTAPAAAPPIIVRSTRVESSRVDSSRLSRWIREGNPPEFRLLRHRLSTQRVVASRVLCYCRRGKSKPFCDFSSPRFGRL